MFGKSAGGLIGIAPDLAFDSPRRSYWSFFFFRWFCGVASNIMSGAVAERMRFPAYCITAVIISAISYPASGHWVRAGVFTCTSTGWLSQLGFIDFANSTVAHSVGGWVSLAAVLIVGPRVERFSENRRPIDGHDLTNATLGVFWRWFGWFGFNGGNLLAITEKTPIIINTAVGGAAGGLPAMAVSWWCYGVPTADKSMIGALAGLVTIAAGAHLLTIPIAIVAGAVGGAVCVYGSSMLERVEIDDAVGACPCICSRVFGAR